MVSNSDELKTTLLNVPTPDTTNISGNQAYSLSPFLRLISMLNTLKLENTFYKTENQTVKELKDLISKCAKDDAYFTAQCIVYSRCVGEGMRTINHLAATLLAENIVTGKHTRVWQYSCLNIQISSTAICKSNIVSFRYI